MAATLRIIRFWTEYIKREGAIVPVDKVEYCAPGMGQRSTTVAPVSQLSKIREDVDPDNPVFALARDRWAAIEPHYSAWKQGQEMPSHGTPLAAWSGITPAQAEIIKTFGLRSVEEVAEASDSLIGRVQLPGMRDIAENARRFLASKDQNAIADALAKKDDEMALLRDQLEEMRQLVVELSQREADPETDEAPRRRGRPPKVQPEAEVAA